MSATYIQGLKRLAQALDGLLTGFFHSAQTAIPKAI